MDGSPGERASIVESLLRLGINRRGRLDANRAWDVALRAGLVVDLLFSGAISAGDRPDVLYVDAAPTGVDYLDLAVSQLLASPSADEWIRQGRLRSVDVVGHLVDSDGWTVRLCLSCFSLRLYRTRAGRYDGLFAGMGLAGSSDTTSTRAHDHAQAVDALGAALGLSLPDEDGSDPSASRLSADVRHVIEVARTEIAWRAAAAQRGSSGPSA
jgi:hypothetical protein